jgi:alkaline phosphatase
MEQNAIFHIIVQHTPRIGEMACRLHACNADGVPVDRPTYEAWLQQVGQDVPLR